MQMMKNTFGKLHSSAASFMYDTPFRMCRMCGMCFDITVQPAASAQAASRLQWNKQKKIRAPNITTAQVVSSFYAGPLLKETAFVYDLRLNFLPRLRLVY